MLLKLLQQLLRVGKRDSLWSYDSSDCTNLALAAFAQLLEKLCKTKTVVVAFKEATQSLWLELILNLHSSLKRDDKPKQISSLIESVLVGSHSSELLESIRRMRKVAQFFKEKTRENRKDFDGNLLLTKGFHATLL